MATRGSALWEAASQAAWASASRPIFLNAPESQQQISALGLEARSGLVMLRREGQFVALLGQPSQFFVRADVARVERQGLLPARDAFPQRPVDVIERVGGGGAVGRILRRSSQPRERPASFRRLLGLVGQEGEFESRVVIGGVQAHGRGELVAGPVIFADLEQGVGEVLVN